MFQSKFLINCKFKKLLKLSKIILKLLRTSKNLLDIPLATLILHSLAILGLNLVYPNAYSG